MEQAWAKETMQKVMNKMEQILPAIGAGFPHACKQDTYDSMYPFGSQDSLYHSERRSRRPLRSGADQLVDKRLLAGNALDRLSAERR